MIALYKKDKDEDILKAAKALFNIGKKNFLCLSENPQLFDPLPGQHQHAIIKLNPYYSLEEPTTPLKKKKDSDQV